MKGYLASFIIVVIDQVSKIKIDQWLGLCVPAQCERYEVLPVFQLAVLYNEGAAFSFLADAGGWQRWLLTGISAVVSVGLAVWLRRVEPYQVYLRVGLILILGGAVGNLIDRALQGYVVDFLIVHYEQHYFPAFNVADAAISVGAVFLLLDLFITKEEPA